MLFQQHYRKIKTKGTAVLGYMLFLDSIRIIKQYAFMILSPKNQMLGKLLDKIMNKIS